LTDNAPYPTFHENNSNAKLTLTKSMLLSGIQCRKRLYLEVKNPVPNGNPERRTIQSVMGIRVTEAARTLFPGGIFVGHTNDEDAAIAETKRLLARGEDCILFGGAFRVGDLFVRTDILILSGGKIGLVEVKCTTAVREFFILDCAIVAWVMEKSGYKLDSMEIAYIDNRFVYEGAGYEGLFNFKDVQGRVRSTMASIPGRIAQLARACRGNMPMRETGNHCSNPHECRFMEFCSKDKTEFPISILAQDAKLFYTLIERGYKDLRDVPASLLTKQFHLMIHKATLTGIPEIHPYLGSRLREYGYPRFFLDFEATQFAVPIWEKTKVFEQLLFQWSCHKIDSDGSMSHADFLDTSGLPPMEKAIESLVKVLGTQGPVFVYSPFEKSVISGFMTRYPHYAKQLSSIANRIVDLLPFLRKYYYHHEMKGSWSIKRVLPTIAPDLSYDKLSEIKDGLDAQLAYQEAIAPETSETRREEIASKLKEYCRLDTYAMVRIVGFFENTAHDSGTIVEEPLDR
jgi:hypothetical protein